MKPVGMCRMCMVEVYTPRMDPATRQPVVGADGKPELALVGGKLQAGCMTPVSLFACMRLTKTVLLLMLRARESGSTSPAPSTGRYVTRKPK